MFNVKNTFTGNKSDQNITRFYNHFLNKIDHKLREKMAETDVIIQIIHQLLK